MAAGFVRGLASTAADLHLAMVFAERESPDLDHCLASRDCDSISYAVFYDVPAYAEVYATYGPCDVTYRHRYVWCLGVWIHVADEVAGMC